MIVECTSIYRGPTNRPRDFDEALVKWSEVASSPFTSEVAG